MISIQAQKDRWNKVVINKTIGMYQMVKRRLSRKGMTPKEVII